MDKIVEEILTILIKRVEVLEARDEKPKKPQTTQEIPKNKPWMSSNEQLDYIKGLGGTPEKTLTKKEDAKYIDKLKRSKYSDVEKEDQEPERKHEMYPESKKLTKKELEALEEEGALL